MGEMVKLVQVVKCVKCMKTMDLYLLGYPIALWTWRTPLSTRANEMRKNCEMAQGLNSMELKTKTVALSRKGNTWKWENCEMSVFCKYGQHVKMQEFYLLGYPTAILTWGNQPLFFRTHEMRENGDMVKVPKNMKLVNGAERTKKYGAISLGAIRLRHCGPPSNFERVKCVTRVKWWTLWNSTNWCTVRHAWK